MGSCVHSSGRGARRRSALTGVALGLLLTGCAVGDADVGVSSPVPRADLARDADVAAANLDGRRAASSEPSSPAARDAGKGTQDAEPSTRTRDRRGASRESGTSSAPAAAPESARVALAHLEDPTGDHGDGPGYSDLTAVAFGERDGRLAVTVTLDATVPGILDGREVEGVGIDLYRSSDEESDYQVFLDGGRGGWRAFLQTPEGFVDFPGTFAVRGRSLEVAVPWSALGGRREATSSVFVDWSEGTGRLATDGTTRVELRPS